MRTFWRPVTALPASTWWHLLTALVMPALVATLILAASHRVVLPGGGLGVVVVAVGLAGAFAFAARLSEAREADQVAHLTAGLEAQAQLETAQAIREVAGNVHFRVGAALAVEPAAEPESAREHPQTHETEGIAGAVDRFYAEALLQSRVWFLASVLAAFVGLVVIVWELIQASNQATPDAALKVAAGLLTEVIAALFYRQANATRKHAADLLSSTQGDRRSETALRILSSIKHDGRREEIAGRLAMHLVGAPSSGRRSAVQARNARPDGAPLRRSEEMAAEHEQGGIDG
jgi:hypothetical protein